MDAIIASDEQGNILLFNPAAEALFGYTSDEVKGRPFAELIIPTDVRPVHQAAMQRQVEAVGEQAISGRRIESVAMNKQGEVFPVELAVARDDSWATPVFTAVIRDVRLRRALEQSLREAREKAWAASAAKSEFIAVLSHELRTPLASIVSTTHLLEEEGLTPEADSLVEIQRDAAAALLSLTSNILDASRLESGADAFDREPFEPVQAARQALRIVTSKARERGVALVEDFGPEVPEVLVGDVGRWRQLIINLLTNALKFTESGSVTLTLSAQDIDAGTCLLRTVVTDTGIGMSEEAMSRIFNPYEQADAEIRGTYGGTGLGLHIVRQLVDAMGGTLSVGSAEGVGSSFAFSIPFARSDSADGSATTTDVGSRHILLVEDHDVNRRLVQRQIEGLGHTVQTAGSVAETLQALDSAVFDVVLMDVGLPDGDGFEATRALRERLSASQRREPLVVALTAGDSADVRDAALSAGMDGFLTKPLHLADLQQLLAGVEANATADAPSSEGMALDVDRLEDLAFGVGWDAVLEAANLYAAEMERRLSDIEDATTQADAIAASKAAHSLKGVAATLGAVAVADQCRTIEEAGKAGELPTSDQLSLLRTSALQSALDVIDYATAKQSDAQ